MKAPVKVAARLLAQSFADIENEYDALTGTEKALCTRREFEELLKWIAKHKK